MVQYYVKVFIQGKSEPRQLRGCCGGSFKYALTAERPRHFCKFGVKKIAETGRSGVTYIMKIVGLGL
jgi:hypothetical protein